MYMYIYIYINTHMYIYPHTRIYVYVWMKKKKKNMASDRFRTCSPTNVKKIPQETPRRFFSFFIFFK